MTEQSGRLAVQAVGRQLGRYVDVRAAHARYLHVQQERWMMTMAHPPHLESSDVVQRASQQPFAGQRDGHDVQALQHDEVPALFELRVQATGGAALPWWWVQVGECLRSYRVVAERVTDTVVYRSGSINRCI
jgi:hypothetical protein